MQEKTIKSVMNKKFNDWLDSITDTEIKKIIKDNAMVCGGAITSLLLNEKPNDYDIYFRTKESLLKVCQYYAKKFNENHPFMQNKLNKKIECFVLDGATIEKLGKGDVVIHDVEVNNQIGKNNEIGLIKNENGEFILSGIKEAEDGYSGFSRMMTNLTSDRIKMIIMSDGVNGTLPSNGIDSDVEAIVSELDGIDTKNVEEQVKEKYNPVYITTNAITLSDKIQIVVRFWGEPDKIHENYDYEHTKSFWSSCDNKLSISKSVYECVINKILKYTGSKYPICSVFRMRKFIERGWKINAGQILKMSFHINELNLKDIDVLEDQLVGVDSVYFNDLINQIKEQQAKNSNFNWDFNYIISIVDKLF
jgi:hypothetical protein